MPEFLQNIVEDSGSLWVALVDLIIVYYLVYATLLLVRGTRSVPMAVGLLLVVLVYTFSRQWGFATTYMLLDQFMSVVVIFTLIIFQDDIRRALIRFGRFASFSKARETAIVEEVTKATAMMTAKKIGALIVFEREATLDEFILESGTKLDSSITKELLYTIFIPMMENPLHDGAAVIRNFQIREAGSFLPLSTNPRIEKTLGTRHRAALGITEHTDAVAVVVSEERGTVSVCHNGKIKQDLDSSGLRRELLAVFSAEQGGVIPRRTSTADAEVVAEEVEEPVDSESSEGAAEATSRDGEGAGDPS